MISIHAPLTGCDCSVGPLHCSLVISIHAPLTGCDDFHNADAVSRLISIHAPLTGCDNPFARLNVDTGISIHAPLTGCDLKSNWHSSMTSNFNPRTPHGVRLSNWATRMMS